MHPLAAQTLWRCGPRVVSGCERCPNLAKKVKVSFAMEGNGWIWRYH
jgi:hypothetical protein